MPAAWQSLMNLNARILTGVARSSIFREENTAPRVCAGACDETRADGRQPFAWAGGETARAAYSQTREIKSPALAGLMGAASFIDSRFFAPSLVKPEQDVLSVSAEILHRFGRSGGAGLHIPENRARLVQSGG